MNNKTRYTLSIPTEIHKQLEEYANEQGRTMADIVRQCLKFGLVAIEIAKDPNSEIFFRERVPTSGQDGDLQFEYKDTRVQFIL